MVVIRKKGIRKTSERRLIIPDNRYDNKTKIIRIKEEAENEMKIFLN